MNPMLQEALSSVLRWALTFAAGWFVQHGIWTQANAEQYVGAASIALLTLGWSLWRTYRSRLKFLTAAASAGLSEHEVEAIVKDPQVANPSVTSPKADIPSVSVKP